METSPSFDPPSDPVTRRTLPLLLATASALYTWTATSKSTAHTTRRHPSTSGHTLKVQRDDWRVRMLDARTRELLREHVPLLTEGQPLHRDEQALQLRCVHQRLPTPSTRGGRSNFDCRVAHSVSLSPVSAQGARRRRLCNDCVAYTAFSGKRNGTKARAEFAAHSRLSGYRSSRTAVVASQNLRIIQFYEYHIINFGLFCICCSWSWARCADAFYGEVRAQ